jgi:hypothetical protein
MDCGSDAIITAAIIGAIIEAIIEAMIASMIGTLTVLTSHGSPEGLRTYGIRLYGVPIKWPYL